METLRHFGSHGWMQARFCRKGRRGARQLGGLLPPAHRLFVADGAPGSLCSSSSPSCSSCRATGAGDLSVGDIVLFNTLLLQLNQPFEMIGHALDDVVRARASLLPLARIWAAPEEPDTGTSGGFSARRRAPRLRRCLLCPRERPRRREDRLCRDARAHHLSRRRNRLRQVDPAAPRAEIHPSAGGPHHRRRHRPRRAFPSATGMPAVGIVPQEAVLLNDTPCRQHRARPRPRPAAAAACGGKGGDPGPSSKACRRDSRPWSASGA